MGNLVIGTLVRRVGFDSHHARDVMQLQQTATETATEAAASSGDGGVFLLVLIVVMFMMLGGAQ